MHTNINECLHKTIRSSEKLMGIVQDGERPIFSVSELGYQGLSVKVHKSNLSFLKEINANLIPCGRFHSGITQNLKLVNELLLSKLNDSNGNVLDLNPACSLMSFPILEEVTRIISDLWDENGVLNSDISAADAIYEWKENGMKPVIKIAGKRISSLETKFQLMMNKAKPKTKELINYVDNRYRIPSISGLANPISSTLASKLYYWRNRWLHGERQDGYEGILVSHIILLIYFGELYENT